MPYINQVKMSFNTISDLLKSWGEKDKQEFVELCRAHLCKVQHTNLVFDTRQSGITYLLYKICWHAMHGNIAVETAISALSEVISLHIDLPSVVADILVILDIESQSNEVNSNLRERFFSLLRYCNNKLVPEYIIKERLDFESLGEAGIIKLLRSAQTKFIKTKTRLFYKQQKFNLFREESEGYAKLITELNPEADCKPNVQYVLEVMKSLIGCFNLDPNRVLDIILESFECKPELEKFFIPLLKSFSCTSETISQVIGFKFGFYQQDDVEETPPSLYRVTALLLKNKVLSLNQLYGLLRPDDNKIVEAHKQRLTDAQLYVKQLNSLSTNISENKEQVKVEPPKNEGDNQKLGLCSALLDVGDWLHAQKLMVCFPDFYATSHIHIAEKLCKLMHVLIDSFYKQYNFGLQVKAETKWKLESGVSVKSVTSFSELFTDVFPMVLALGPHLHIDPVLMAKIIRLSRQWLSQKTNLQENGIKAISSIINESLLSSLSLLECNCCVAEELWNLLKLFSYQERYNFYSHWKTSSYLTHPLLMKIRADTLKRLKYIMKRLSKENVKPTGRQIGKLSHSNPGYIFDYILSQIQAWDNLIIPVIDSLKYLTSLSYDVMAYCVIEALANSEKLRMKHDGTSISLWLQSLAHFAGAVFKKYPIEIAGLLQYVANQLKFEKSLDLLILKEVVQKMAGIEASEELTTEQLEAMTGGELLKSEGGYFNQLRNVKKSSQRLKEALLEQDLAIPLCVLMAQQRQCILFHEQESSHLKLVGKLYDQCQDTLVQYGSFLSGNLNMDDYANRLPTVSILLSDYFIQADVGFFLARPSLNYNINSKFDELRKQDKSLKTISSSQSLKKYLAVVDSVMSPIVQSIKTNQAAKKVWEDLSPQFYVTFWSLSMYDLVVPSSSYEREVTKLKALLQSEENKDAGKKKKERERCEALITKLIDEEKMQHDHCSRVMARLKSEKDSWFQSKAAKNETITQFLQLCLFPRSVFTPVDAIYCAKFVHLVHCLKTPNFSTLLCYDRVFCDITYTVAACTENEANRYGMFLCSMLETVTRWHSDKAVFDKECANFPGFMTKFKVASQTGDSPNDHVDYENYRHVCHKWHFKLTKALLKCLESGDYVQIRNSLLVLSKISPYFPVVMNLSQALERRIDRIRLDEKEKRPDIYALATGYSGVLKSKRPILVQETDFHLKGNSRLNASGGGKTDAASRSERREIDNSGENIREKVIKTEKSSNSKSSQSNNAQSTTQSSGKRAVRGEVDQNGIDGNRVKSIRIKDEKDSTSPMRRDDKNSQRTEAEKISSCVRDDKKDRRDDYYDKALRNNVEKDVSENNRESYTHRRSGEPTDLEREHKRRRTEGSSSSRSPREIFEREVRSIEKVKEEDKNGSREKQIFEKVKEEVPSEKTKVKEKKTTRKRDYSEENASEPRRRRVKAEKDEEESGKRSIDSERDSKSRREDKSPVVYVTNSDRRVERDEKKHHRSSSASGVKKRS